MIRSARVTRELGNVAAKYPDSQAVEDNGGTILVIPTYPMPAGFNRTAVRIAIKVSGLYPSEKLDLMWIDPDLRRVDGSALPNVMASNVVLAGQMWTQISWHDNAPHNPQLCTILGYLRGVRLWFAQQVGAAA